MEIENFINEVLVDFYCNLCEISGMDEIEIDSLFRNEDWDEISDKDAIRLHADEINDEMIQDEVYWFLKDNCEERDISIESLVSYLVSKYFIFNYDNKNKKMVNFIKTHSIEEIVKNFQNNDSFGRETIDAYIRCLANEELVIEKRKKIFANNDQEALIKLEATTYEDQIITVNELLRNIICNLYNFYIQNGYDDISALNTTWEYFLKNFDPLGELDKMGVDQNSKIVYKQWMICLIYADLYEDAANTPIIQSENYEDRLASVLPLVMTQLGMIRIPNDEGIRNRLLKSFILLQDDKEKMYNNRRKTYEDNRINTLKKVNPTFVLDELTFNVQ